MCAIEKRKKLFFFAFRFAFRFAIVRPPTGSWGFGSLGKRGFPYGYRLIFYVDIP
jgi:hypothetical protein